MVVVHEQADLTVMRFQLPTVFTPAAPVSTREMFAGRTDQITQVIGAVSQMGQHAVIFGERGVGKTSLATVIREFWVDVSRDDTGLIVARVNCDTADTFGSIWKKVIEEIELVGSSRGLNQPIGSDLFIDSRNEIMHDGATPSNVRRYLHLSGSEYIIILDEFDRIEYEGVSKMFSDTIKAFSDHTTNVTLVIVGVADTVEQLIGDHSSIDRAMVQIHMPRMTVPELKEVVETRFNRINAEISPRATDMIARLSQGLPHYAHLLGLNSGLSALNTGSRRISEEHVENGIRLSLDGTQESTRSNYHLATMSPRTENLYKQVMLACAMAKADDLGYFAPADVRQPMSVIMKKPYPISAFARHLNELCQDERGKVLQKIGRERKWRYRFTNPLLKPYILFRGVNDGMVSIETIETLT